MMDLLKNKIRILGSIFILSGVFTYAGNPDRTGEAGASQLLLNSNARSYGINGINSAKSRGIYALSNNVAGLAYAQKTTVGINYTSIFAGTQTNLFNASLAQELSEGNVLGININSLNYGNVMRTTVQSPGGTGNFSPTFLNIGLSYGRLFTEHISGGIQVKFISESIDNLSASGLGIDAGLQYTTGKRDNVHFGVAVRNIGMGISFAGDGFAIQVKEPGDQEYKYTVNQGSSKAELPSLITIAGAYDLYIGSATGDCYPNNRLTLAGNFVYNSFTNNLYGGGLEYSFKELFALRVGYAYELNIFNDNNVTAKTGFTAGFSYDFPLDKTKKDGPVLSIDYAFGMTRVFNNNHCVGLTYSLASNNKTCRKPKKVVDALDKTVEVEKKVEVAPVVEKMEVTASDKDSIIKYSSDIKFKTGSDTLNKKGMATLNKLYDLLVNYPKANIIIDAHTDNDGTPESNMTLSQKRAEAVKAILIEKGIKESKIKTNAFGDTQPLAPNDTDEGKALNRRVHIKVEF